MRYLLGVTISSDLSLDTHFCCMFKLAMVKSYCLPLLTYYLGALSLTRRCVQDPGVCWNDYIQIQ